VRDQPDTYEDLTDTYTVATCPLDNMNYGSATGGDAKGGITDMMELYVNSNWTECYEDFYIAEAIAWSENGNHATIFAQGITVEEADAKLMGALRELKLIPQPEKGLPEVASQ
jgi:hypothetical protein